MKGLGSEPLAYDPVRASCMTGDTKHKGKRVWRLSICWVSILFLMTMLACSSASSVPGPTPLPPVQETPQPAVEAVTPPSSPPASPAVPESQPTATVPPTPSPTLTLEPSAEPSPPVTPTLSPMPAREPNPTVVPPEALVEPPPFTSPPVPPSSSAITITIPAGPYAVPVYNRKDWKHWSDLDQDCQDARHEVLIEESLIPVTFKSDRECQVASGRWLAAFTGTTVEDPSTLDVDHLVPLKNAHHSGAAHWAAERKEEYANYLADPEHLIAVTRGANRSKGARGPDEWRPPDETYWCTYATDWAMVKEAWGLWMSEHEAEAVQEMLGTCAEPPVVEVVREQPSTGPGPTPTGTSVHDEPGGAVYQSCDAAVAAGEERVLGSQGNGRGFPKAMVPSARDGDGDGVVCER